MNNPRIKQQVKQLNKLSMQLENVEVNALSLHTAAYTCRSMLDPIIESLTTAHNSGASSMLHVTNPTPAMLVPEMLQTLIDIRDSLLSGGAAEDSGDIVTLNSMINKAIK